MRNFKTEHVEQDNGGEVELCPRAYNRSYLVA